MGGLWQTRIHSVGHISGQGGGALSLQVAIAYSCIMGLSNGTGLLNEGART